MRTDSPNYKRAFGTYMRRGTPIALSLKEERTTTHYIWRTRRDGKVRPSHAVNEGRVFAWDDPPPTGHPGEDYGCRCTAEPHTPDVPERMVLTLSDVKDEHAGWSSRYFVEHYLFGQGESVTVRQTGHLVKIVQDYISKVDNALKGQIADQARQNIDNNFRYTFVRSYNMTNVVFSIGNTVIGGEFNGSSRLADGMVRIYGDLGFYLRDEFADPLGRGFEVPGATVYAITDRWSGSLNGEVYLSRDKSRYTDE